MPLPLPLPLLARGRGGRGGRGGGGGGGGGGPRALRVAPLTRRQLLQVLLLLRVDARVARRVGGVAPPAILRRGATLGALGVLGAR